MRELPVKNSRPAIISDVDFTRAKKFKWYKHPSGYVHGYVDGKMVLLHHFVKGKANRFIVIDHINKDKYDNRRSNLRRCKQSSNLQRKSTESESRFRGVRWHKRARLWQARIRQNGHEKSLGYFSDIKNAAIAYNKAALTIHGLHAAVNVIK